MISNGDGPSVIVQVAAPTVATLEERAVGKARAIFGPGAVLRADSDYTITTFEGPVKDRLSATITVYRVNPARGRIRAAEVTGASPEQLEAMALAKAAAFFGPAAKLEVRRDYVVHDGPVPSQLEAVVRVQEIT